MRKRPLDGINDPQLFSSAIPQTAPSAHKYHHGHAIIFAGGLESVGAARLAAGAALRIGAGLVSLAVPTAAIAAHAARGPDALMLRHCDNAQDIASLAADKRHTAALLGPAYGVGAATRVAVQLLASYPMHLVLDADALTSFSGHLDALTALTRQRDRMVVLTPHEGEFMRLFGAEIGSELSKKERAARAAQLLKAIIVLKGAETIIASPDGRSVANHNAPPWLATAGSGDVLAGLVTGLLARNTPPYEAACAAVWVHGAAGTAVGRGLIADDLPEAVGRIRATLNPLGEVDPAGDDPMTSKS